MSIIMVIVILVPAGIAFILAGNHFRKKRLRIIENAEIVELPVLRMIEDSSNSYAGDQYVGPSYYPVFELEYGGKTYELKTETWSHKTQEGEVLPIRFNRENPYEYEIYGDKRMVFVYWLFIGAGITFFLVTIIASIFFMTM